jgi:hypothetical protein
MSTMNVVRIKQASTCREKAQADPERYDHWIDESVIWLERAIEAGGGVAIIYEVRDGGMVPKIASS